jgi:hypothetical protein
MESHLLKLSDPTVGRRSSRCREELLSECGCKESTPGCQGTVSLSVGVVGGNSEVGEVGLIVVVAE